MGSVGIDAFRLGMFSDVHHEDLVRGLTDLPGNLKFSSSRLYGADVLSPGLVRDARPGPDHVPCHRGSLSKGRSCSSPN
jgi:hypothetical protein